jgi:RNA polymerase sigma-70 factor (ECF subfamily)
MGIVTGASTCEDIDRDVRAHADAGDVNAAITAAIQGYGDEVYSFLMSRLRDDDIASDVFAQASADLLTSLPTFRWRCSLRTWFYRLARAAAARHVRSPSNRPDRRVALSHVSEVIDQVRSRTQMHLRSEVKDGFRKLRDQLDPDEQQLLMLRIDRNLGWSEIAEIVDDDDDPKAITRASARLRQQFQTLKDRLRDLAIAEGLLPADEG